MIFVLAATLAAAPASARIGDFYGVSGAGAIPRGDMARDFDPALSGWLSVGSIVTPRLEAGLHAGAGQHPATDAFSIRRSASAGVATAHLKQQVFPIGVHGRFFLPRYDSVVAVFLEGGVSEYFFTLRTKTPAEHFPTERRGRPGVHAGLGVQFGSKGSGVGIVAAFHNIFDGAPVQYVSVGLAINWVVLQ